MNIQDLQYLSMLRLDVSCWSGRSRLNAGDLPSDVLASVPPEDLVVLGSKRLYPPEKLKVFNTLKARAVSALDKKAVRFLGGWATHEERLPEIASELEAIANEFYHERDAFVREYSDGLTQWANTFPQYHSVILAAAPTASEVDRRFAFNWQAFKVSPEQGLSGANYSGDNLHSTIAGLEYTLLEEVARGIRDCLKECFDNKNTVTKKAFRPIRTLIDKVRGLTFLHPNLCGLEQVLTEAVAIVENHADDPMHVTMFKNFLNAMQSPQSIEAVLRPYVDAQINVSAVFDPFWSVQVPPSIPAYSLQTQKSTHSEHTQNTLNTPSDETGPGGFYVDPAVVAMMPQVVEVAAPVGMLSFADLQARMNKMQVPEASSSWAGIVQAGAAAGIVQTGAAAMVDELTEAQRIVDAIDRANTPLAGKGVLDGAKDTPGLVPDWGLLL